MATNNRKNNILVICPDLYTAAAFQEACKYISNYNTIYCEKETKEIKEIKSDTSKPYIYIVIDYKIYSIKNKPRDELDYLYIYYNGLCFEEKLNDLAGMEKEHTELEFKKIWTTINAEGNLEKAIKKIKFNNCIRKEKSSHSLFSYPDEIIENPHKEILLLKIKNDELENNLKKEKNNNDLLKLINKQRIKQIDILTSDETYKSITCIKNKIKNPRKWIKLALELSKIFSEKKHGLTSSNPLAKKRIFLQASQIQDIHKSEEFIKSNGSGSDLNALNLIKANSHLNSKEDWLKYTNRYIEHFNIKPLLLSTGNDSILGRVAATPPHTVFEGPRISVIMPAYNSAKTLRYAAESILNQSWRNLELIIINDCSTDSTLCIAKEIANKDSRVIVLNNQINVGPYVSKNRGVDISTGEYITGHDADDWAFPHRLEMQCTAMQQDNAKASACAMLRIEETGKYVRFSAISHVSADGALRLAYISTMFCSSFFQKEIGYWDSVRYAADSEIIGRTTLLLGESGFLKLWIPGMLCLESTGSLTNHPETGISSKSGLSATRSAYRDSWSDWHQALEYTNTPCLIDFPQNKRQFDAPVEMCVSDEAINQLLKLDSARNSNT